MRKKYLPFLLFFSLIAIASAAQVRDGYRFLKKEQFNSAMNAFEAGLAEQKTKAQSEFGIANVYADSNYNRYSLDSAYIYVNRSQLTYRKLKYDVRKKVRKQYSSTEVNAYKRLIEERAIAEAQVIIEKEREIILPFANRYYEKINLQNNSPNPSPLTSPPAATDHPNCSSFRIES